MTQLPKLKEKWTFEGVKKFFPANSDVLMRFQNHNNVNLTNDLKEYFELLNGTGAECTNELYEFYSIDRIKKLEEEFSDWQGIPNYQLLLDKEEIMGLFVFANFSFNLFAYAVRLNSDRLVKNEVYVLCGGNYKKISNTFTEFIDLYLNNSIELQLNKEET